MDKIKKSKRAKTALKESEILSGDPYRDLCRDLCENLNALIQCVTLDGRYLYVNPCWLATLEYTIEEIGELSIFNIIDQPSHINYQNVLERAADGELVNNFEVTFLTKSGKKVFVEGNVNVKYLDGKPASLYGVFLNITARKLVQQYQNSLSAPKSGSERSSVESTFDRQLAEKLPFRILIAEDNAMNQKLIASMLEKMGYQADVVANGLEVLRSLMDKAYDIIFMDVQMPVMDGIEAARKISQIAATERQQQRPYIIAMTGSDMPGDREDCLAAGMTDYLSKPIRFRDLQQALERAGQRREV